MAATLEFGSDSYFLLMSYYVRLLLGCQLPGFMLVQREANTFMLLADILFILNIH